MTEIILTEEQSALLAKAPGRVAVRDPKGNLVGHLEHFYPPLSPEEIAELKRRAAAPGPRYTSAQVQARLRALQEEWDRTGGFDEPYMHQFLERLNADDPGHMRPRNSGG